MANIKRFTLDWNQSGLTVYGIIVRENDTYQLNDADGDFAAAPADPYISFTEHPTITGRYILNEDRTVWQNGPYTIAIYSQQGGAPNPSADVMIGSGEAVIYDDLIRSTVIYPPGGGGIILSDIIRRARSKLDDEVEPYLWSNDDLTDYLNEILNELCTDINLLEDDTNETVCKYSMLTDEYLVNLFSRITVVKKAKLASQSSPLMIRTAKWMDEVYPGWKDAASGVPSILITEGVGSGKARLYPPTNEDDTLWLTVYRLQLVDMFWGTDQDYQPEILPIYHDKVFNGILSKAYLKQDVDTLDLKKAALHAKAWLADKEAINRSVLKSRRRPEIVGPHPGMM